VRAADELAGALEARSVPAAASVGVGDNAAAGSIVGVGEGVACVLAVSCGDEEQPDCPSSTAALTRQQRIKVFERYFIHSPCWSPVQLLIVLLGHTYL
jgi:hypothetical protein